MVLFGKVTGDSAQTGVGAACLALKLQQSSFAAIPAAPRREMAAERRERYSRKAVATGRRRRQSHRPASHVTPTALIGIKESPVLPTAARNNDTIVQLSGGRFPLLLFLVRTFSSQTVRLFFTRGVELRWWRLVRNDLDERGIQPRRNQHWLCIQMKLIKWRNLLVNKRTRINK